MTMLPRDITCALAGPEQEIPIGLVAAFHRSLFVPASGDSSLTAR